MIKYLTLKIDSNHQKQRVGLNYISQSEVVLNDKNNM